MAEAPLARHSWDPLRSASACTMHFCWCSNCVEQWHICLSLCQVQCKNHSFEKSSPGTTAEVSNVLQTVGVYYGHQHWGHKEKELFVKIPQSSGIYRRHCRQEIWRGRCTAEVDYIQIKRWKVKLVEQKSKFALFNESYKRKFLQLVEMQKKTNPE